MFAPTVDQIRSAIAAAVRRRSCGVDEVAGDLHISPSTLHRRLRSAGTTFAAERRSVQVQLAFELLTGRSHPVEANVASRVGISRDYLRIAMRTEYGITPSEVLRVRHLVYEIERSNPTTRGARATQRYRRLRLTELLKLPTPRTGPVADWVAGAREALQPDVPLTNAERERRRRKAADVRDALRVNDMTETELRESFDPTRLLVERQWQDDLYARWRRWRRPNTQNSRHS